MNMSLEDADEELGEGSVSGNQASIPADVRAAADIEDGDRIRWRWRDGELQVEVVRRRWNTAPQDFDGFEPMEKEPLHHDDVGLEPAGDMDAGEEHARGEHEG